MRLHFITLHLIAEPCLLLALLCAAHGVQSCCVFVLRALLGQTAHVASGSGTATAAATAAAAAVAQVPACGRAPLPLARQDATTATTTAFATTRAATAVVATGGAAAVDAWRYARCKLGVERARLVGALARALYRLSPCAAWTPASGDDATDALSAGLGTASAVVRDTLCATSSRRVSVALSFVVWTALCFGAVFVLHVPSAWKERVQMARPTKPLRHGWYANLRKPRYTPPTAVFPLVWISLKTLQCVVMTRQWEGIGDAAKGALRVDRPIAWLPRAWAWRVAGAPDALALQPLHVLVLAYVLTVVAGNMWTQLFFVQLDLPGSVRMLLLGTALHALILHILYAHSGSGGVDGAPGLSVDFWLYLPTLVWICMALALNVHVWLLNRRRPTHELLRHAHAE